jgi:hypothetical protein
VADLATSTGLNFGNIIYGTQHTPLKPTLHLTHPVRGQMANASDKPGACPTPVTFSSHCWWGAALSGVPSAPFGVPGFTVLANGSPVANTLTATPAVYCAQGATATACTGMPVGTLIAPHLSGTISLPAGSGRLIVRALEPNITPDPGNGPSNTVAARTILH